MRQSLIIGRSRSWGALCVAFGISRKTGYKASGASPTAAGGRTATRISYALGMGAGTQVLTHLPWFVLVGGTPGEASRAIMMGLAWIINAIVAEYVIRTRLAAPAGVPSGQPHSVLVSPV